MSRTVTYRICKSFEIESGHMLFKHPGLCRFPHGHTRKVEVVISSRTLNDADMVCDFKLVKLALGEYLKRFDHAMVVNSRDPAAQALGQVKDRVITLDDTDPTTEVLARLFFQHLDAQMKSGAAFRDAEGNVYRFEPGLTLERVRVWETSSSWGEFGPA